MLDPGEARTVQPQPQEGVRLGIRCCLATQLESRWGGESLKGETHKRPFRGADLKTPGNHPFIEGGCRLLQVSLRLGQTWCPADNGYVVSVEKEV